MADDGAVWRNGLEAGIAPPVAQLARERFQDVLSEFSQRLAAPHPMRRETAVALVQQLERLGRRMASELEFAEGRAADLDAALAAITRRLESEAAGHAAREAELIARIDGLVAELAQARAAKRPLRVGTIVAAVTACAAIGGAGVMAFSAKDPTVEETTPPVVPVEVAAVEPEPAPTPDPITPANTVIAATPVVRVEPPRQPRMPRVRPSVESYDVVITPPDAAATEEVTHAAPTEPAPNAVLNEASMKDTQTFLAQQGYYIGPIDGQVSVTLKEAAEAYLRDHKVATIR